MTFFLAAVPHYWGVAETAELAKANMRRAGGRGKSCVYRIENPPEHPEVRPFVDDIGMVHRARGSTIAHVSGPDRLGVKEDA